MNSQKLNEYIQLAEQLNKTNQVVVFPSIGEYLIYDDLSYLMLVEDEGRMAAFESVIAKSAEGKTVFDIGTGNEAALAVICIKAGAEHVYAVEIDECSANNARAHVNGLGLADKITIIHGDSIHVEFPGKVDVCVAEIIGNIGGAEGAPVILKNALRFLNPDSKFIPEACITEIAPASLPEHIYSDERLSELEEYYSNKIYTKTGRQFPLTRYAYYNFPVDHILAEPEIFENDQFNAIIFPEIEKSFHFEVDKDGNFDGFLLWIKLHVDADHVIDSLSSQSVWAPVFLKTKCIPVAKGDVIQAVCKRTLSDNQVNPDYVITGSIQSQKHCTKKEFSIASPYIGTA